MNKLLLTSAIIVAGFISSNVMAADAAAGKAKSAMCAACHGAAGISATPMWPNLAGQKEAYTLKQLKAFKDGSRKDATMLGMVAALSDDDMANLAAYYASLK